jgi:hypothetical protein
MYVFTTEKEAIPTDSPFSNHKFLVVAILQN